MVKNTMGALEALVAAEEVDVASQLIDRFQVALQVLMWPPQYLSLCLNYV